MSELWLDELEEVALDGEAELMQMLPRAVLAGKLLGHELAWDHRETGLVCDDHTLGSFAQVGWQADGRLLAGSDGDYIVFLAAFLEAYRAG